ncbi:MAG: hypothetical protein EWV53_21065 [Microcystis panniformis Mp_MB_F_20051200_S9]|uniref:DUF1517 domain-containing protein n=1 Tax=Microcystis panniformis Mp_MB_F_20051200_S9 TaxID=2486223 RepID=A0A552PK47_9CHRO|nr:MAG: hypothetical protein EWV42_23225 [Microcystis panniformis Mp_GB_SS_20050300_S99D]TRV45796.1 MAG: hypothetical protein EWV43_16175 [Microcystis panniformis Mp_MB_F_20080800_S26D]TRV50008.1 MAG: hypothetical protein EWV87_09250 [Microcystis panniformis Mp_GB_SS_20050300_S99]TRV57326.1 MAG: hypothetical protein EWV53_21065 [Microcystis panniformis Mp_MB_F_20051200_S9]TRV63386.1 MAG: hypothetical protein EWV69_03735 [Microcystis panniformis Mp_MB_F_20080800_S26]TRV67399.1 MAG: hypothetical
MSSLGDRFKKFAGKTRYVVCRLFLHLYGQEVAPLIGILNRTGREAIDCEGDLEVMGEGLVEICQNLLQMNLYWFSVANEGDVFWSEGEAGDYVNELFTDSAGRYLSESVSEEVGEKEPLTLPVTDNLVIMITIAFEGESAALETSLADREALEDGLKSIINLHYQGRLRAIQVHFSPAQLGDELTNEQLLLNFPELLPL